ncbi:MAG: ribonuclease P protein component [Minisyncoccia bacterium]
MNVFLIRKINCQDKKNNNKKNKKIIIIVDTSVSKKAVVRNKIKRQIKALLNSFNKLNLENCYLIKVNKSIINLNFQEIKNEFLKINGQIV